MSKTDMFFNKVLKTSLLITTISFVLLVLDLFFALINQALDCSTAICVIDADQPFFKTSIIVLVVLIVLFILVARTILLFLLRQTELLDAKLYREMIAELVETEEEFSKSQLYEEIQKIKAAQQVKEQDVVEPDVEKGQLSFDDIKFDEQDEEIVEAPVKTKKKEKVKTIVVTPEIIVQEEPKIIVKEIKEKKDRTEVEILQDRIKSILNKVNTDSEDEIEEEDDDIEEKISDEEVVQEISVEEEVIEDKDIEDKEIEEIVKPTKVSSKVEKAKVVQKEIKRTKIDIIEYIEKNTDLSKNKANIFLKYFAEVVRDELAKENDVEIPEFGVFTIIEMPEKDAVNPQTNEPMVVPAHKQARLRFDSKFKDKF